MDNEFIQQGESLIERVKVFVQERCKNRDDSHNWKHMYHVFRLTLKIFENEGYSREKDEILYLLICYSALLHDVYDHKYENSKQYRIETEGFLIEEFKTRPILALIVIIIIDNISYSKENRDRDKFQRELKEELSEMGIKARNIVSDADKITALGKEGYERCRLFVIDKEKIEDEEIIKMLIQEHAQKKLFRLLNFFIKTKSGKEMAEPLHKELIELLK